MRSLKSTGGLTRRSGMTERQRLTWLLSMPACAETNLAMQELTGIKNNPSEQNKDMTNSRQTRDMSDTVKVLDALMDGKNPFAQEPGLRNIINGVNAEDKVDVDKAREKGVKILSSIHCHPFYLENLIVAQIWPRGCENLTRVHKQTTGKKKTRSRNCPRLFADRQPVISTRYLQTRERPIKMQSKCSLVPCWCIVRSKNATTGRGSSCV